MSEDRSLLQPDSPTSELFVELYILWGLGIDIIPTGDGFKINYTRELTDEQREYVRKLLWLYRGKIARQALAHSLLTEQ